MDNKGFTITEVIGALVILIRLSILSLGGYVCYLVIKILQKWAGV